ncbi:MAG: aldo/keto reductase, partial [Gammaproteobacteria bacterium]|nr:aldo/keto reductase [Gammaproteobacteria bacterium]
MTIASRKIGSFEVHPVGLGCMNLSHAYGPAQPHEEAVKFLQHALDIGYNFLDTATIYGMGNNEKLIGEAISHRRDEFVLASKCVMGFKDGKRFLDGRPETILLRGIKLDLVKKASGWSGSPAIIFLGQLAKQSNQLETGKQRLGASQNRLGGVKLIAIET